MTVAATLGVASSTSDALSELELYDMIALMKRVAIYARACPDCLLSEDQQIERLRTIAAERGWTVTSVCSDRPTTVRKGQDRRPGELALIEAIRSGAIDGVLLWSIDRIGKSLVELVGFMETCRRRRIAVGGGAEARYGHLERNVAVRPVHDDGHAPAAVTSG